MPAPVSRCGLAAIVAAVAVALPASIAGAASAPGAPGQRTTRASSDQDGFGTSLGRRSRVWFTLSRGKLTGVSYLRLDVPSVRDPQLRVESLNGRRLQVWVRYDPALGNDGDHDRARTAGSVLTVRGGGMTSALAPSPALSRTSSSSGYLGMRSDPWRDLRANARLDRRFSAASRPGNVVQLARLPLTGLRGSQRLTMALSFAQTESRAQAFASLALRPRLADLRGRARRVRARVGPAGGRVPAGRRGSGEQRRHDPGAGVGRPGADRRLGPLRSRRADVLRDAAGVVARGVRAAGVVDRRGPAGGAAGGRRVPVRGRVRLGPGALAPAARGA